MQSYASGVLPNGDSAAPCPRSPLQGPLGGALGGPPSVVLLVQYLGNGEDGASSPTGRLAMTVVEARCLPSRDYGASPDPSVQLSVAPRWLAFPFRWFRGHPTARPRTLHQLRTRSVRHSRQPRFNEDFAVEARRADIKVRKRPAAGASSNHHVPLTCTAVARFCRTGRCRWR